MTNKIFEIITAEDISEDIYNHYHAQGDSYDFRKDVAKCINTLLAEKGRIIRQEDLNNGEYYSDDGTHGTLLDSFKYEGLVVGLRLVEEEKVECDHTMRIAMDFAKPWQSIRDMFVYCPKCGERLKDE